MVALTYTGGNITVPVGSHIFSICKSATESYLEKRISLIDFLKKMLGCLFPIYQKF